MLPPDGSWPQPYAAVPLADGEVHIWRVGLTLTAEEHASRTALLSVDERERAGRFLSIPAQTQFIAARSALRSILALYQGCEPAKIRFQLGPLGKPALVDCGDTPLYFNLSHSRELALIGVTACGEIGVDVELVREMSSREQLAERFFHPNEVAALRTLPVHQKADGFFNAWTRKEAFLKATGKGISYGIERVEVTLAPGVAPAVLAVDGDRDAASAWQLAALTPATGYVGAVAMQGKWTRIRCYSL